MNYIDALTRQVEQALSEELRPTNDATFLYGLYALLALIKGQDVTLENVHDSWSLWKSRTDPHHESIIPFADLDPEKQAMDLPYVFAIRQVSMGIGAE